MTNLAVLFHGPILQRMLIYPVLVSSSFIALVTMAKELIVLSGGIGAVRILPRSFERDTSDVGSLSACLSRPCSPVRCMALNPAFLAPDTSVFKLSPICTISRGFIFSFCAANWNTLGSGLRMPTSSEKIIRSKNSATPSCMRNFRSPNPGVMPVLDIIPMRMFRSRSHLRALSASGFRYGGISKSDEI